MSVHSAKMPYMHLVSIQDCKEFRRDEWKQDAKGYELLLNICNPYIFRPFNMANCAGIFTRLAEVQCLNTNANSIIFNVPDPKSKSVRVFKTKDLKGKTVHTSNIYYNALLFHFWFHRQILYIWMTVGESNISKQNRNITAQMLSFTKLRIYKLWAWNVWLVFMKNSNQNKQSHWSNKKNNLTSNLQIGKCP